MANEETDQKEKEQEQPKEAAASGGGGLVAVSKHMLEHKIDSALWLTRILTLIFSISYFLPFFQASESSYMKVLMSNAATSALRLQQRTTSVTWSREFLMQVMAEDSFHYLLYSLNFIPCSPVTLVLVPVILFALLHFASYSLMLCDVAGKNNLLGSRFLIGLVQFQHLNILRAAAFVEIFLLPLSIINLFLGRVNLVTPVVCYQFLMLRYKSRRNPYTRTMFYELRLSAEHIGNKSFVPAPVRNLLFSTMNRISMLAPQVQQ